MKMVKRREFLSQFSCVVGTALVPLTSIGSAQSQIASNSKTNETVCWLDVTAPFVIEDSAIGMHSEIVLTSDTFSGVRGYDEGSQLTEYEIYLYDPAGKPVGSGGVAKRLTVPAMHTTVLRVRDLLGGRTDFLGGMRVRLRPQASTAMHASDLFSSAYLRLTTDDSFDLVHANPDPLQWHRTDSFYCSMPFPSLKDYSCFYSLFNPYPVNSEGSLALYDHSGRVIKETEYFLKPFSSQIFDLQQRRFVTDLARAFAASSQSLTQQGKDIPGDGGTIAVTNNEGTVKSFGYLLIKRNSSRRFSIDHPIHQSPFDPVKAKAPFDAEGRLKVKNILYTPLAFRSKKIAGVTLNSRFHFSAGSPVEERLWLRPFISDSTGTVAWQPTDQTQMPATISPKQVEQGVLKLGRNQACVFDCSQTSLPNDFAGGLSLAIAPLSNHTLMKVEVRVEEWGAHAFTHFRPGLNNARAYQKQKPRGGIATDYIATGARVERKAGMPVRDALVCVFNIDDKGTESTPTLEIFSPAGLLTKTKLEEIPGFGCRHFVLSEILPGINTTSDLTLRLVDDRTTLVMSLLHLDYVRRDIALDHGSDRFSTFQDFNCNPLV